VNSSVAKSGESLGIRLDCAAHHEAGHIVIAAVQGLKLRADGLIVDTVGEGLACYFKEPEENDLSRERVAIASFAGFKAEKRVRQEHSYSPLYEMGITLSPDWVHARKAISKLSTDYPLGDDREMIRIKLESISERLVEENWATIQGLAAAVLARDLTPPQPLQSMTQWSDETMAKYLTGEELVSILRECGITAVCGADGIETDFGAKFFCPDLCVQPHVTPCPSDAQQSIALVSQPGL
jgi:hypothetical protein